MSFPLEGPHAADTLPPSSTNPPKSNENAFVAGLQSALMISHRPPKNPILKWIWKKRMMLESTFCLIMLNLWEKVLVMSIVILFLTLIYISITNYLPSHLFFLRNRIAYYVYGDESVPLFSDLWGWLGGLVSGGGGGGAGQAGVVLGKETVRAGAGSGLGETVTRVVVTGRPEL